MWEEEAGEVERRIEEGKQKKPPRLPTRDQLDALQGKPELDLGTMRLMKVYNDLSSCRSSGFGVGRIRKDAVIFWALHNAMAHHESWLWEIIVRVDSKMLPRWNARQS